MNYGTLSALALVPEYQTREAYEAATGSVCPPYDPLKPIKNWASTNLGAVDDDGNQSYLSLALSRDGAWPLIRNGAPYLRVYNIPSSEAYVVNIPIKEFHNALIPEAEQQMGDRPIPMRSLNPGEELFLAWGGRPEIRNKLSTPVDPPASGGGVVTVDLKPVLDALELIDNKLDVILNSPRQ